MLCSSEGIQNIFRSRFCKILFHYKAHRHMWSDLGYTRDKAGHATHSLKLVSRSLKIVAWYLISFGSKITNYPRRPNEWMNIILYGTTFTSWDCITDSCAEFLCCSCFKYVHCPPDPIDVSSIHDIIVWVRDTGGPSQIKTQWSSWRWVGDLEIF